MVRGSAIPASLNLGQVLSSTQHGEDDTGVKVSEVDEVSLRCDKKKWRRLQRSKVHSNQFQFVVPHGCRQPVWELGKGGFPQVSNMALHQLGEGMLSVIFREIHEEASTHSEVTGLKGPSGKMLNINGCLSVCYSLRLVV